MQHLFSLVKNLKNILKPSFRDIYQWSFKSIIQVSVYFLIITFSFFSEFALLTYMVGICLSVIPIYFISHYLFIIIKNFIGKFFRKKSWDGNDSDGDLTIFNLLMSILVCLALLYPAFGYFYIHPKYVCSSWKQKGHDLIREYSYRNDFGGDFPEYSYEKTKGDYSNFSFKSKLECEKVFRSIWSRF